MPDAPLAGPYRLGREPPEQILQRDAPVEWDVERGAEFPHLIQQLFGLTGNHDPVIHASMKRHKANFPVTPLISDIKEIFPAN